LVGKKNSNVKYREDKPKLIKYDNSIIKEVGFLFIYV